MFVYEFILILIYSFCKFKPIRILQKKKNQSNYYWRHGLNRNRAGFILYTWQKLFIFFFAD